MQNMCLYLQLSHTVRYGYIYINERGKEHMMGTVYSYESQNIYMFVHTWCIIGFQHRNFLLVAGDCWWLGLSLFDDVGY